MTERRPETLGEAAQNPDGTYDGAKALAWISSIIADTLGGKGLSEDEIKRMWAAELAKRGKQQR